MRNPDYTPYCNLVYSPCPVYSFFAWLCSILVCFLVSRAWVIFLFWNVLSRYFQSKTTIFKFWLRFGAPSLTLSILFSMHTHTLSPFPPKECHSRSMLMHFLAPT